MPATPQFAVFAVPAAKRRMPAAHVKAGMPATPQFAVLAVSASGRAGCLQPAFYRFCGARGDPILDLTPTGPDIWRCPAGPSLLVPRLFCVPDNANLAMSHQPIPLVPRRLLARGSGHGPRGKGSRRRVE